MFLTIEHCSCKSIILHQSIRLYSINTSTMLSCVQDQSARWNSVSKICLSKGGGVNEYNFIAEVPSRKQGEVKWRAYYIHILPLWTYAYLFVFGKLENFAIHILFGTPHIDQYVCHVFHTFWKNLIWLFLVAMNKSMEETVLMQSHTGILTSNPTEKRGVTYEAHSRCGICCQNHHFILYH